MEVEEALAWVKEYLGVPMDDHARQVEAKAVMELVEGVEKERDFWHRQATDRGARIQELEELFSKQGAAWARGLDRIDTLKQWHERALLYERERDEAREQRDAALGLLREVVENDGWISENLDTLLHRIRVLLGGEGA